MEHYKTLEKNASNCIQCGHCDSHCPFSVKQSKRMNEGYSGVYAIITFDFRHWREGFTEIGSRLNNGCCEIVGIIKCRLCNKAEICLSPQARLIIYYSK